MMSQWNKEIECQKNAILENVIREGLSEEVTLSVASVKQSHFKEGRE